MAKKKKTDDTDQTEAPTAPPTQLVSAKELSRYLNVSRTTIGRMVKAGQIPYTRVRGLLRFDVMAVRAVLDRHR